MSEVISQEALLKLVDEWLAQGRRVAGPARVKPGQVMFVPVVDSAQLLLDGYVRPGNSIKEFFFPRHENIYGYRLSGSQVELIDWEAPGAECVIIGARPCDAAALPALDHVFNWDTKDEFYNRRRAATTIVTVACAEFDENCFCTSVGLGPAAENGSDALLLALGGGRYELRPLTEKGTKLFAGKAQPSTETAPTPAGPEPRFDTEAIRQFLEKNFEHPLYQEHTMRCLACGACAYTCPTCHCFDIVDEGNAAGGCRAKNWDSCQFGMFTAHASGHNPRSCQAHRQRQRVQHKFRIYPEKFGVLLCTGCGNCTRNCPVSLGIQNVLEPIQQIAVTKLEQ